MHKVTRSSSKALKTTMPFGCKTLIPSRSNSLLNNYSTSLKRETYSAPLTNNNKTMKNLFADNNTTPTTRLKTLDPTLFKKWTREEVCSGKTANPLSTNVKKENFINVPTQLRKNNKLMNIFVDDFKNYSSSSINDNETTVDLNPVEYESWSKEEVCSLLHTAKKDGGAGLTFKDVKPLYDADFKGTSLANIVTTVKDKDKYFAIDRLATKYPTINPDTLETVVNWVDNLLKTRLYHLWTSDQAREQLCKHMKSAGLFNDALGALEVMNFGGEQLYILYSIIQRTKGNSKENIMEEVKKFIPQMANIAGPIIEWVKTTHLTTALTFKNTTFAQPAFNDLSYQNNKKTIRMMADVFLKNIKLHRKGEAIRYQTLLINSAYFGSGKTRLGVEFLTQWQLQMTEDPAWKRELIHTFSQDVIEQLVQSRVVYVNCKNLKIIENDLSKTFQNLEIAIGNYLGCSIRNTPCLIILDEVGSLVTTYTPPPIQGIHKHFSSTYSILNEFILPFQQIPTVSLYVCGKGAFMDIAGTGRLRPALQSPTLIKTIHLESFSEKDIKTTVEKTTDTSLLASHLKDNGLFDYFIQKVNEETRGIPYFVVHYVLRGNYSQCLTKEDIDKQILEARSNLPASFLEPYLQFSNQPMLMQIYHTLLFAGIMGMEIDVEAFNVHSFFDINAQGTEFEGIAHVNMLDIGSILNCYLQPVANKFKLLFPQAIIERYLGTYISASTGTHFSISWLVNEYSSVLSSGDIFEHLTLTLLRFRMSWGAAQNSKIGEVFPFLNNTSVAKIPCYKLETINLKKKLMKADDSNKEAWKQVIEMIKGTGKLGYFYDASHSPDKFWDIKNTLVETYIQIQDKNLKGANINFKEEIHKNEKVRMVVGDDVILIMLFMIRSGSSLAGTYQDCVDTVTLHKNTTVVVLSEEEAKKFYGDSNLEALKRLSLSNKL